MRFFESLYCANAECSLAAALPEFDDKQPFCVNDDIDDNSEYGDQHFLEDDHDDIHSPAAKVARLSSPADVSNADAEDNDAGEYEFVSEHKFPANIGDEVHVELVKLCRTIGAPLYAYDKILAWSQEAHAKGYMFPITAPRYNTFMTDLAKRLELNHLSHTVSTITKAGGGTSSFPTFNFESMFISLLDDTRIQPHLHQERASGIFL